MFGIDIKILILLGFIAVTSLSTWQIASWKYGEEISDMRKDRAKAALEQVKLNREIEMLQISYNGAVSERNAYKARKTEVKILTITKEVIKYVKSPEPKCDLTSNWVHIHDGAISSDRVSEDASTSSGVDDPSREVGDDVALAVITANYGKCNKNSDRLEGLQDWAKGLQFLNSTPDTASQPTSVAGPEGVTLSVTALQPPKVVGVTKSVRD